MAKIIELPVLQKRRNDQVVADFIAEQEISDFEEVFNLLVEQSSYTCLFGEIDFRKYYDMIMSEMYAKNYSSCDKLNSQTVEGIVRTYSERMDLEDLATELKRQ